MIDQKNLPVKEQGVSIEQSTIRISISDANPLFLTFEMFGGRLETMSLEPEIRIRLRLAFIGSR